MAAKAKTALSGAAYAAATLSLERLNQRMYDLFTLDVAPREIFEHLVSADDRAIIAAAAKLGLMSGSWNSSVTLAYADAVFDFSMSSLKLPMPSDFVGKKFVLAPTDPYADRIAEYYEKIRAVAEQFATARAILDTLNTLCHSPKQLRFFMPSIVPLLKMAKLDERANELAATPIVRNAPNLPFGSRQALIDTNALIAKATLVPERERLQNRHKQFVLRFNSDFKAPWGKGVKGEMMSW